MANDAAADPVYRNLAALMWVLRSMDTAEPAVLTARLAPLMSPEAPFSASARELAALVQLKAGQRDEAPCLRGAGRRCDRAAGDPRPGGARRLGLAS